MSEAVLVTLIGTGLNAGATIAVAVLGRRSRPSPVPVTAADARERVVIHLPTGYGTRPARGQPSDAEARGRSVDRLARVFDPIWAALDRLPALRRRVRPWLAAVLGFGLGGIGIVLYLRSWTDVVAGVVLVAVAFVLGIAVYAAFGVELAWYHGAALPALYGYFRAWASNRALALSTAPPAGAAA